MCVKFDGECKLSVRIANRAEYLRWCKYVDPHSDRWDFEVEFPAIMRRTYKFSSALDISVIANQIISLLQMGFDVHASNFKLEQKEVASETSPKVEDEDP